MKNNEIPRPEYPRPQMMREEWKNLNGKWQFEIDNGKSGRARGLVDKSKLEKEIVVPFCPESKLSGIENTDFMEAVWYKRKFEIPENWQDKRILIHFGAVDYETEVWINGESAGTHRGGYTPFSFDITDYLQEGINEVTVCAEDDVRSGLQPGGKQSPEYDSFRCYYTRTTGIWQTVWLEPVAESYIENFKVIPDPDNESVEMEISFSGNIKNYNFEAEAILDNKTVGKKEATVHNNTIYIELDISEVELWEPENPVLYDLKLSLLDDNGKNIDEVESYFGLRTVSFTDNEILLNGKPVFQRLVLDQGFYPEGIYTAPSDEALKKDVEIGQKLGFNGARLHEKIFEPRFLYWADKKGYLVWGEHANWNLDITTAQGLEQFLPEWLEAIKRDFNHPALIGWCPFNETWDNDNGTRQDDEVLRIVYETTKAIDKTRPVIDTSGNYHVKTDIFDIHDYEQEPEKFAQKYSKEKNDDWPHVTHSERQEYNGQPYFVSEYGGIWWNPEQRGEEGWGYGERPTSEEEFLERYKALTETLLNNPEICAFCYTQLYDIEQEVNGLYTYDRKPKFDPEIIKEINIQQAAIEK
ncbi:MAG: glycoside hydrolase family 2 protein [Halanaerobiales bacterium]